MDKLEQSLRKTSSAGGPGEQGKITDVFSVELDEDGNPVCLAMGHHAAITDKGVEFAGKLHYLKTVRLWPMTDKRLVYLTQLPDIMHADFRNLNHGVSTDGEDITDAGMIPLSELHGLETLYLSGARISDSGLNHLKGLTNLEKLQVEGSFSLAGLKNLSSIANLVYLEVPGSLGFGYAEFCPNLEEISDFNNNCADSDLAHLRMLAKLRVLTIVSDKVTDHGIRYLKGIKSLRQLMLGCPNVTELAIKELQGVLSACTIQFDPSPLD